VTITAQGVWVANTVELDTSNDPGDGNFTVESGFTALGLSFVDSVAGDHTSELTLVADGDLFVVSGDGGWQASIVDTVALYPTHVKLTGHLVDGAAFTPINSDPATFTFTLTGATATPPAWASVDDVVAWAGGDALDVNVTRATSAANVWCFNRRQQFGYTDDPSVAPDDGCNLAVVLYAESLLKGRGAADGFAGFADNIQGQTPGGGLGQINKLLRVPRPATG
jgi:hypothetical protein